jgi:N-acetylglutamate synthase-like GNAT family acetyltransferase
MKLEDITIRTELQAGDLGYIIYLHGVLYEKEYGYAIAFESYVAMGLHEFYKKYNPERDGVWICEHKKEIIGFLLLMDRGNGSAQLRYFILKPDYWGIGLGKNLMNLYMNHLRTKCYKHSFLWTTHEQEAAAHLYKNMGFILTEEKNSTSFGKPLIEQRYDLTLPE